MAKSFDKIVEEEFRFLISDFQFHLEKCKKIDGGFDIVYANNVCGVRIYYEFREAYIFITLYKLQNGRLIANPRPLKPESKLTGYSLDYILLQRAPNAIVKPVYSYGAGSEFYDKERGVALYVSKFAKNLREHASDVLRGDFKIFEKLEPIVKKRSQTR
jgi:hypothetical protein